VENVTFVVANLSRKLSTKFHQNRPRYIHVEDIMKNNLVLILTAMCDVGIFTSRLYMLLHFISPFQCIC